jgi:methyl-accepting chemotaxis protein
MSNAGVDQDQNGSRKRGVFSARFMRSLSIGAKMWSVTALLSIPLLVLAGVYVHSLTYTLWSTAAEQRGYMIFQPLDTLAQRVVRREELEATAIARKSDAGARLKQLDEELDAAFVDLLAIDAQRGSPATHAMAKDLQAEWQSLKASASTQAQESMAAHEHLLDTLSGLSVQVISDSKLSLDSETTADHLIDLTTVKLPDARRFLTEARAHMAAMYSGGSYVAAEGARVASLIALFNDRINGARNDISAAHMGAVDRPALILQINELGNDWDTGIATWTAEVTRNVATGHPPEDDLRSLLNSSAKYPQSLDSTQQAAIGAASVALRMRYASQMTSAGLALVSSGLAVILAMLMIHVLSRRIAGAIARLIAIAGHVTEGRYDSAIDDGGTDEISRLFAAMNRMQRVLAARGEEPFRSAAPAPPPYAGATAPAAAIESSVDAERIRAALDGVSGCVMVADLEGRIVYTNSALDEMLRAAESDIRRQLPSFSAATVRGANFEVFHQRAQQQRHMVASLSRTHRAQIELGGRTFTLILNPVNSPSGGRIGTSVEWADRTAEVTAESEVNGLLQAVLGGDLSHRIDLDGKTGFFEGMSRKLNQLVDDVQQIISKVQRTSSGVHGAAEEISQGNSNLLQRIEQQSASLEQTASSMEQITSTVKQNADNAHQANQLASAAREQAQAGGTVVNQAITAMADINESSKKIANIIGVIDEIAFQTNLLALNAAVEAARAGEQGRGFAVVASEVRSLAGRSAGAAKEIKELIRDSVGKVEGGTELVAQSGKTLEQIVIAVKKVTDVVAEIASASSEQTRGIEQVNVAITHMDQMTQQNTALIEQTSSASQAMAQQSEELTQMLSAYRTGESAPRAAQPRVATPRAAPPRAATPRAATGRSRGVR